MNDGLQLYEHRNDESVIYLVRRLESSSGEVFYEMTRYRSGSGPNDAPFVLRAEDFEPVYRKRRTP